MGVRVTFKNVCFKHATLPARQHPAGGANLGAPRPPAWQLAVPPGHAQFQHWVLPAPLGAGAAPELPSQLPAQSSTLSAANETAVNEGDQHRFIVSDCIRLTSHKNRP